MSGLFIVEQNPVTEGTFTRSTVGSYIDNAGVRQSAAINALRMDFDPVTHAYSGVLWEPAATNLLLNSATLATQNVTVTAQPYTLTFYGAGSVTLSGAAIAVAAGSGAYPNKTTLTFTPAAGTLTLTVAGSVTEAQLEAGSVATSYIATAGATVTRAADVLTGGMCSTLPETDYPQWAGGTGYLKGDRVIRTTTATHKIYQRAVAGTTATAPELDSVNWAAVSPTNVWKAFDGVNNSQVLGPNQFSYVLKPGKVFSSLDALNLTDVTSVRVRVIDPTEGVVYDQRTSTLGIITEAQWYSYFYSNAIAPSSFEANLMTLPPYPNAVIVVDFTGSATMALGVLLNGVATEIGHGIEYGARMTIVDYSRKEPDAYGSLIFVERAYAKRADIKFSLANDQINIVYGLFARLRATPHLIIGYSLYTPLTIFGFYKEFEILIKYEDTSDVSVQFEGLT